VLRSVHKQLNHEEAKALKLMIRVNGSPSSGTMW
jgi:hypothetical protein